MGTTLTALQTGSINYKYVVAIEGIPYLLTDATSAQALAAWTGTDWTTALQGLTVDLQNKSQLDPWSPFSPGGTCRFAVVPDQTLGDIIGVMTGRSNAGDETQLVTAMQRTTSAITVDSANSFAASGEIHIGTECLGYSGKTATSFTGLTRGKYAPFTAGATTRLAHDHRVIAAANQPQLRPMVSEYPRVWIGRYVGVWMHRVVAGVLDLKSEAQLVFAGRVAEVRDDAETGACMFDVDHILDDIKNAVVFKNPMGADISDGVYIPTGITVADWFDANGTTREANALVAVTTPTLSYEMQGNATYTLTELCDKLNSWLEAEKVAARLHSQYVFVATVDTPEGTRGMLTFYDAGGFGTHVFGGVLSAPVAVLLGWSNSTTSGAGIQRSESSGGSYEYLSPFEPLSSVLPSIGSSTDSLTGVTLQLEDVVGNFFEQTDTLIDGPDATALATYPTGWGLFLIDGKALVRGLFTGSTLEYVQRSRSFAATPDDAYSGRLYSQDGKARLQQIVAMQKPFAEMINMIFFGTGESAYNGASDLGFQGLGIPNSLLGATFTASTAALQESSSSTKLYITKPTKLVDLLGGDLIIRRASLIWKNQGLRMVSWSTPSAALALHVLTESNKAEPNGTGHRSATSMSTQYVRNIVKFEYHRSLSDGQYERFLTLEDGTSVDDHGGNGSPITISLPHSYDQDASVEALIKSFLVILPWWSRANPIITRSISPTHYEDMAAGDIVTVTDAFARDPVTGIRGVTARTGIVLAHNWSPGGARLGGGTDAMVGDVTIMMGAIDRNTIYSPAALIDVSANTGGFTQGYNSGTLQIRCVAHAYSNAANDPVDASNFAIGDKLSITTVDSLAPSNWTRTVTAVSGNDITLNAALAAPAFTSPAVVRSDAYSAAVATQKLDTYQALSTTSIIASTAPAAYYTTTNDVTPFDLSAHDDRPELIPTSLHGDGVAHDTAVDYQLAVAANWLHDHGTAHQSPCLKPTEVSKVSGSGYTALMHFPVYLGGGSYQAGVKRTLDVAPMFRSATGTSVTLRVTLLKYPMQAATLTDAIRPTPYSEVSFTTTSTTAATPTAQALDVSVIGASGIGWILIEGTIQTATRGLAICIESERTP